MKRDMDLVRLLLLRQEGETDVDLSPYTEAQIRCHSALLIEAGLVDGKVLDGTLADDEDEPPHIFAFGRLTWAGHDFLDAARSEPVWRKALAKAKDVGSTVSFDVLKALLVQQARGMLGIQSE